MMTRHCVVATKAATQSLSHILKIPYFGGLVAFADADIPSWLAAAIAMLAFSGTWLSRSVLERISDASFRLWTRRTIMALGAI